jgi:hypothetical protein
MQGSPLRFAPVEMTGFGVREFLEIARDLPCKFLNIHRGVLHLYEEETFWAGWRTARVEFG